MQLAVVLIAIVIAITIVGHGMVRRFVDFEMLDANQGVTEAMLGVVGTLFSVLLGLLVAGAIESYHDVKLQVAAEANGLANVFRLARGLSNEDRPRIRKLCREYGEAVITEEWPLMAQRKMSDHCWELYQELWEGIVAVNPEVDRQNNIHQVMLEAMQNMGENRRLRSISCQQTLSLVLWFAIICGALITLGFTYFFAAKMGKFHSVLTALIGISLALNIWLLAEYSAPFAGELQISPDIFKLLRTQVFTTPDTPSRFIHDSPSK